MDGGCNYYGNDNKVISFQTRKYLEEYSEHDREIAIKYLANCENPSQFFTANGMIDVPAVIGCIENDMRKKILSEHKYAITQLVSNGKSNGRWQTFLPDPTAKNGRRQIRRANLNDLEDDIIEFYTRLQEEQAVTIEKIAYEWLEKKRNQINFKASSYDRYENQYLRIFDEDARKWAVPSLTAIQLEEYFFDLIAKKKLTMRTWNDMKTVIRGIFKQARKRGYTDINIEYVLEDVTDEKKAFALPKRKKDSDEVFTDDEEKKIESYILGRENISLVDYGVLLLFQTGIRVSELSALKFSDFDIDGFMLDVSRIEQHSKNAEGHIEYYFSEEGYIKCDHEAEPIYLTQRAIEIYALIKEMNPSNEFMFYTDHFIRSQAFTKRLNGVCKLIGIKPRSAHKARKTYATKLINGGVSEAIVKRQLHHKDISTTRKYYYFNNKTDEQGLLEVQRAMGY